jgi:hypothetical protein
MLIGSVLNNFGFMFSCYFLYKCGQLSSDLCKIWTYVRLWFDTFPAVVQTKTVPWVTATLATTCTMKTSTITSHECTKKQYRVAACGMLVSYLLWQYKIHTFPAMYMICDLNPMHLHVLTLSPFFNCSIWYACGITQLTLLWGAKCSVVTLVHRHHVVCLNA